MAVDFPVILRVCERRCVVVGGGAVARRRALSLMQAGALVTIIAPNVDEELLTKEDLTVHQRGYQAGDLDRAFLAVIATDDPRVNERVAQDAVRQGVLVNRTDDPDQGDVSIPAHTHEGPVTLAVYTGNVSATAACKIRDELSKALDPDWPRLLGLVKPFRQIIQEHIPPSADRTQMLKSLADEHAMQLLKREGEQAILERCQQLTSSLPPQDTPSD